LATFLSQILYAYIRSARCGELRKWTEVGKNREKDTLRGFKVIQGHRILHQSRGYMWHPINA